MSLGALSSDLPRMKSKEPVLEGADLEGAESNGGAQTTGAQSMFDALSKFIPTEMLAPFAAALSLADTTKWAGENVYFWFVVATPVVYLLFEFGKTAMEKKPWPLLAPLAWRGIAATVAFSVWALAMPSNPVQAIVGGAAVAGFLALVISPVLTAVDAIVLRLITEKG